MPERCELKESTSSQPSTKGNQMLSQEISEENTLITSSSLSAGGLFFGFLVKANFIKL